MQLITLFAILAPVIATVQAECYDGGSTWPPDQVLANNLLDEWCNGLYGNFEGEETKYVCRDASSPNKKLEFWIQNTAKSALYLSKGDCVLRLGNEINGCKKGGHTTTDSWHFRADPNEGRC